MHNIFIINHDICHNHGNLEVLAWSNCSTSMITMDINFNFAVEHHYTPVQPTTDLYIW